MALFASRVKSDDRDTQAMGVVPFQVFSFGVSQVSSVNGVSSHGNVHRLITCVCIQTQFTWIGIACGTTGWVCVAWHTFVVPGVGLILLWKVWIHWIHLKLIIRWVLSLSVLTLKKKKPKIQPFAKIILIRPKLVKKRVKPMLTAKNQDHSKTEGIYFSQQFRINLEKLNNAKKKKWSNLYQFDQIKIRVNPTSINYSDELQNYLLEQKMGQFKALAVKNWILYKRSPLGSILELVIPIIFVCFLILVRNLAKIDTYDSQQYLANNNFTFRHFGDVIAARTVLSVPMPTILKSCSTNMVVALAPDGDPMVTQMNTILTAAGYSVRKYASDSQIDTIARHQNYGIDYPYFCFGLTFENSGSAYKYNLRFNVSNGQSSEAPSTTADLTSKRKLNLGSYQSSVGSGFVGLTNVINNLILQAETVNTNMLVNKQGPIYQEQYINDPIYSYLSNSMEFLVLLPLLVVYLRQVSSMLYEKEKKIRESMSITGMKLWIYYLTWFIRYFAVYLVIHLICSAIISRTFTHVPYYIPLVVFVLFDILLVIQAFFVQIFVTRAKIGIIFALLFFVLQYVINYIIANNSDPTVAIYRAVSVVPHVAFILAFKQMLYAESLKINLTFTQVLNQYTIATAIISIIFNIIFWGILTWYLDQVFPNEWGAKKHPCFCCVGGKNQNQIHSYEEVNKSTLQSNTKPLEINLETTQKIKVVDPEVESVEGKYKEMEESKKAIIIRDLNKSFNDQIHAVKNLSMSIYSDQIFVLLGHNGAGKTTTISMLTGMIQPTSGLIEVLGETNLTEYRSKIGVCPQHDTLYEDLTVEEHIRLFATFRGLEGEQLEEEVDKLIKDVNLDEKKNQYSKNLSGGQKRRLSVAMAFSGGAKVIILDEPTSGMDTSARRYIWEMLKNYKNDRIILLTTHFMDEADYLGDRIAIMAGGKLVALGSNVYLKNKFGVGYNIAFVKKSIDISSQNIIKCVSKYVNDATVLSDVSSQVVIQLPMDKVSFFPQMFNEIDAKKQELGIQTYGISITTLEEVFLKVGEQDEEKEKAKQKQTSLLKSPTKQGQKKQIQIEEIALQKPKSSSSTKIEIPDEEEWEREDSCCQRFMSHMLATILKRIRVIRRDLKSFIFELVLPMLIILLALMLMRVNFIKDFTAQQLTFKTYTKQTNPVYIPISASSGNSALLNSLKTEMQTTRGDILSVQEFLAPTDLDFDQSFLFAKKLSLSTLKGGIYFQPPTVQSGINTIPFTSIVNTRSPTSVVTIQTLAAQAYINYLSPNPVTITIVNKPLPRTYKQLRLNNTISGFFGAMIFSIALSFKFASIVSFIVKERQDKSKHQQIVSGMNIASYWIGNYIYDFVLYLIVAVFSVVMCQVLKIEALTEGYSFTATCLLFLFYGLANISLTYILGYLFKDYGNAQGAVYFFNFVTGGILTLIILVLRWIDKDSNKVGRGLAWVLRIIPSFSFGEGLVNMGSITLISTIQNEGKDMSAFDTQIALVPIIYLVVFGAFYFSLMFILEWLQNNQKFMRCFTSQNSYNETQTIDDDDVKQEQKKALAALPQDYQILTKELRKVYIVDSDKKYKVAVDNLSFGINKGEVFGLLGVNGAGKTTTFKMLAGEIVSTSGESFFTGLKISQNLSKIRKNLGYCPQFDALIENLTVKQQLELFYDMKCLPKKYKQLSIERKIKQMNLDEYQDKLSGTLSGGNKRKLSVAMAMIGNPSIIFLDEPSTGMDPKARRFMWKVISRISTERKQSTVILTTHSMEEAEALSTRLGIMVNGNFKCIGTPQHIKSKFGKGFEIEVKVKNVKKDDLQKLRKEIKVQQVTIIKSELNDLLTKLKVSDKTRTEISKTGTGSYIWAELEAGKKCSVNNIVEFHLVQTRVENIEKTLKQALGEVEIIQHFQTFVRFKTGTNVSVGKMFNLLESKKSELYIMQYSIKQATVEQIFNKFAEEDGNQMD